MSAITEAVELVNQQARAFKAVQLIADVVRQIGDLEVRLAELNDSVAKAAASRDELNKQGLDAQYYLDAISSEREKAGVTALEQARVDATAIVAKAAADAKAATDEAAAQVKAADDMLTTKGVELRCVTASFDAVKVQLAEVEAKLAAANEAVRKMLGGGS